MNLLVKVSKNKKITWSLVLTIITYIYELLGDNAEILGISTKTLTIVFLVINVISFVWDKYVSQEESAFKMLKRHIGPRPPKPPKK